MTDMETRYKICDFHKHAYLAERCLLCEMQEGLDSAGTQTRALRAQNAELLAALEAFQMAVRGAIDGGGEKSNDTWGYLESLEGQARAAIAAAKGEAA